MGSRGKARKGGARTCLKTLERCREWPIKGVAWAGASRSPTHAGSGVGSSTKAHRQRSIGPQRHRHIWRAGAPCPFVRAGPVTRHGACGVPGCEPRGDLRFDLVRDAEPVLSHRLSLVCAGEQLRMEAERAPTLGLGQCDLDGRMVGSTLGQPGKADSVMVADTPGVLCVRRCGQAVRS